MEATIKTKINQENNENPKKTKKIIRKKRWAQIKKIEHFI